MTRTKSEEFGNASRDERLCCYLECIAVSELDPRFNPLQLSRNETVGKPYRVGQSQFRGVSSMCDYSLYAVASRAAAIAEILVSTEFTGSITRGFSSPDNPAIAVCLLPGTEIEFESEVRVRGVIFSRKLRGRMARFRRLHPNNPRQHHDALEFSNGVVVMVNELVSGQRAKVLQLPAGSAGYRQALVATARSAFVERERQPTFDVL
jgi:hypothetical protein